MDSIEFYQDDDEGTAREIGPFHLAEDRLNYGETPAYVALSPLDIQYLLTLVEFLKEREVWLDNNWQDVINYIENLEVRLKTEMTPGMIMAYPGDTAPDGFLLCDGSEKLKSEYPLLYAVVSTRFGLPSNGDYFKLPDKSDLQGLASGTDWQGESDTLGYNGLNFIIKV